ncbi:MAG: helix-turn-helix domain-containing protein [Peptococcaceae bacterium]|nr:helix-turn-helix domain-containing protein [Peptococcaceae bacterium]
MKTIFATRLQTLRVERDMTLEEFAKMLGTTKPTIWRYENDENVPSMDFVMRVSAVFGVSADWIAGLSDIRESPYLLQKELLKSYEVMTVAEREKVIEYSNFILQSRKGDNNEGNC